MADKEHIPRWSLIAFNKSVLAVADNTPVYLEGDERTTNTRENFLEVRLDGPDSRRLSRRETEYKVTVDVLANCKVDPRDHYSAERLIGKALMAFTDTVQVQKWGDGVDDDEGVVGCYQLDGEITVNKFGIIDQDARIVQATIAATYKMTLSTT